MHNRQKTLDKAIPQKEEKKECIEKTEEKRKCKTGKADPNVKCPLIVHHISKR